MEHSRLSELYTVLKSTDKLTSIDKSPATQSDFFYRMT